VNGWLLKIIGCKKRENCIRKNTSKKTKKDVIDNRWKLRITDEAYDLKSRNEKQKQ
jgi:hypothetical protein